MKLNKKQKKGIWIGLAIGLVLALLIFTIDFGARFLSNYDFFYPKYIAGNECIRDFPGEICPAIFFPVYYQNTKIVLGLLSIIIFTLLGYWLYPKLKNVC